MELAKRITEMAYQKGIKTTTGTGTHEYSAVDEMKLLVDSCGFSTIDAIIAGIENRAEAIGIQDKVGTIEENKIADIVVLDKNPIDNMQNIDGVNMVIKAGRIYTRK